jgi:zinc transport system substrate-binding protein
MRTIIGNAFAVSLLPRVWRCSAAVLLAGVMTACGITPRSEPSAGTPSKLPVVTTFLPITLFTRAVAGDCATVKSLIPATTGPHDVQAKPGDLAALRQARVFVKNGLEMEAFLDKLVASAGNSELVVIDSSRGIATIDSPEEHVHSHEHGHSHGEVNPHIWLDPLRAVEQVETIRDGLIKADPSCAQGYTRNAAAYTAELRSLNDAFAAQLKPYQGKTFITFHDFAPYFAQRYKLKADFLVDVPELNPSPADLQRLSAIVQRQQIKVLLSEPQEHQPSYRALANDLGVAISVFDPLGTGSEVSAREPDTYFVVMRRNVADLIKAFGG